MQKENYKTTYLRTLVSASLPAFRKPVILAIPISVIIFIIRMCTIFYRYNIKYTLSTEGMCTHTDILDKATLRNQMHVGLQLPCNWFTYGVNFTHTCMYVCPTKEASYLINSFCMQTVQLILSLIASPTYVR